MKVIRHLVICTFLFSVNGAILPAEAGQPAGQQLMEARRLVKEGRVDFAMLQYRAFLRDHPRHRHAHKAAFAIGEYYFNQHLFREAIKNFQQYEPPAHQVYELLVLTYLLQCTRNLQDVHSADVLDRRLMELLSLKPFFLAFGKNRQKEWISPLGNRYRLREFVDRMEIFYNGTLFHTIHLS